MPVELKIPEVGESIQEVEIAEWLKSEGDTVTKDEDVVSIESEKASVNLPAPISGRLSRILKRKGTVKVGETIAQFEKAEVAAGKKAKEKPADKGGKIPAEPPPPPGSEGQPGDGQSPAEGRGGAMPKASLPATAAPERGVRVMPAARRLLEEHGLRAEHIEATGPGGRLLKEDVLRHLETGHDETARETPAPARTVVGGGREEEIVPMSPLRRTVARRLVEAKQATATLTTFNEIDMTAVIALRKQNQEAFQQHYQVKLGFMSFFVKAVVGALKLTPQLNAEVRGDDIVYRNYYDIGMAIGSGRGLVVPVVRNAERLSFAEIEAAIADFAARAKASKLKLEELQGGTFTITNGGVYGSLLSTPLLNPPQSGVLGLHAIQDRPVAVEGAVVIRPMMYVALSYDHRLVDGREAVTFLKRVKETIETPARMLLEV